VSICWNGGSFFLTSFFLGGGSERDCFNFIAESCLAVIVRWVEVMVEIGRYM
jgi:hypothetical protein